MGSIIGGLLTSIPLVMGTFAAYNSRKNERPDLESSKKKTWEGTLRVIKNEVAEITKEDEFILASDINYEAIIRNKRRLNEDLRKSVYGVPSSRRVVIALIRDILVKEFPKREDTMDLMDFDFPQLLDSEAKWIILIQRLQLQGTDDVIGYIETNYHITEYHSPRNGYDSAPIREFDYAMLDRIFEDVVMQGAEDPETVLSYDDILDTLAVMFFERYRGFGPFGPLLTLKCDGINFGTSGSIRYELDGAYDTPYKTTNSVWVQINAKWVMFSFIDFYTVKEMRRVVNQLVSWGATPPMTEKMPYKVTDGWDGSRRTAIRPPASEAWAVFIRNFTLSIYTKEQLLNKPYAKNWELPAELMYFLMRGEQTTAFTGQQNTGKTTMMKSVVGDVNMVNIRVLEMSFELALREIYKTRNILTVKPTDYVSSSNLQDLLKKTDGYLSMVGEVAEDIVAARMIQFCLIASAFTIFSHHGKDDPGLITGLRNSLVASGEYSDAAIAESLVLDAIKNNVHMGFTTRGERVVEYISQIIKENEISAYPEINNLYDDARRALRSGDQESLTAALLALGNLNREYYTRRTDRVKFSSRKIVVYNETTRSYEPNEWYTPEALKSIMMKLNQEDRIKFGAFYRKWWGDKK